MSQTIQGAMVGTRAQVGKESAVTFTLPLRGYWKVESAVTFVKKIYEKSFLHDFQNVLTSEVL